MKIQIKYLLSIAVLVIFHAASAQPRVYQTDYQWAIVGAGPAGLIAAGLLMDAGVPAPQIVCIDPEFNVGRLGKYYRNVPANSRAQEMSALVKSCSAFAQCSSPAITALHTYPSYAEFPLGMIAEPMKDIMLTLINRGMKPITGYVTSLDFKNDIWQVSINSFECTAARVILATGAEPVELTYPVPQTIPLDQALDKETLATYINENDTVAVVGSGASAILLLKYLSEIKVKQVINLYKYHHSQARKKSLIRGVTAEWIKTVLDKAPPKNLVRILNTQENRNVYLPQCTKIIYAIGYKRNPNLPIHGDYHVPVPNKTGILGTRIFGFGFAFPEELTYQGADGLVTVPLVGLTSFMNFARRVMPKWLTT